MHNSPNGGHDENDNSVSNNEWERQIDKLSIVYNHTGLANNISKAYAHLQLMLY